MVKLTNSFSIIGGTNLVGNFHLVNERVPALGARNTRESIERRFEYQLDTHSGIVDKLDADSHSGLSDPGYNELNGLDQPGGVLPRWSSRKRRERIVGLWFVSKAGVELKLGPGFFLMVRRPADGGRICQHMKMVTC